MSPYLVCILHAATLHLQDSPTALVVHKHLSHRATAGHNRDVIFLRDLSHGAAAELSLFAPHHSCCGCMPSAATLSGVDGAAVFTTCT